MVGDDIKRAVTTTTNITIQRITGSPAFLAFMSGNNSPIIILSGAIRIRF